MGREKALKPLFAAVSLLVLLSSCALDVIHVDQIPTQLDVAASSKNSFELQQEVKVNLPSGYSRVLKKGTKWDFVGTASQGDVYKTKDQVLTVEASNIHEAYIVISSGKLVGFYLPVERSFSPLGSVSLPMKEIINDRL
jgi:hypothetical protein